jgi:hypothetical protein
MFLMVVLMAFNARADEPVLGARVETESFKMLLPAGWKENKREEKAIFLVGPGSATAQVSIARITGEGSQEENDRARAKLKENLRKAIESGTQDADYLVAQAVQEKVVANGNTVISAKLRTRDRQSFVHQYGLPGPGAGLFITVEGPVTELFNAGMLEYYIITTVQWK